MNAVGKYLAYCLMNLQAETLHSLLNDRIRSNIIKRNPKLIGYLKLNELVIILTLVNIKIVTQKWHSSGMALLVNQKINYGVTSLILVKVNYSFSCIGDGQRKGWCLDCSSQI